MNTSAWLIRLSLPVSAGRTAGIAVRAFREALDTLRVLTAAEKLHSMQSTDGCEPAALLPCLRLSVIGKAVRQTCVSIALSAFI